MKLRTYFQLMIIKTLASTCLALLVCAVAYATTVYKWNEDGKTIYSQTPPPPGVEFEIVIKKDIGKTTSVAKAKNSSGSTFEQRREERQQKKSEKEVLEESNRIKQENCAIAQRNKESLSSRGQVTIKEGDVYRKLTEEERQGRIQETQSQIEEFCQS